MGSAGMGGRRFCGRRMSAGYADKKPRRAVYDLFGRRKRGWGRMEEKTEKPVPFFLLEGLTRAEKALVFSQMERCLLYTSRCV